MSETSDQEVDYGWDEVVGEPKIATTDGQVGGRSHPVIAIHETKKSTSRFEFDVSLLACWLNLNSAVLNCFIKSEAYSNILWCTIFSL